MYEYIGGGVTSVPYKIMGVFKEGHGNFQCGMGVTTRVVGDRLKIVISN